MSVPQIEYREVVRLIGRSILEAIPEGAGPTTALNALMNVVTFHLGQLDRETSADEYGRTIMFLVGQAKLRGISLAELRGYCQDIATDDEGAFFHDPISRD